MAEGGDEAASHAAGVEAGEQPQKRGAMSDLCGAIPAEPIADLREKGGALITKLRRGRGDPSSLYNSASLYDPSMYLCGADAARDAACGAFADSADDEDGRPIPASVLSDPSRTICVVTTAAMPWRTGTAVNPLLRALYLVRFQNEERERRKRIRAAGGKSGSGDDEAGAAAGSVVLVIPWLESESDRLKLYGPSNAFDDGPEGALQQEEWIRSYAAEACGMPDEARELRMIFYPAFYLAGFGSVFPKVDLCNFIPRELVDVAILEEPEHLNWFRMPNVSGGDGDRGAEGAETDVVELSDGDEDDERGDEESSRPSIVGEEGSGVFGQKVEVTIHSSSDDGFAAATDVITPTSLEGNASSEQKRESISEGEQKDPEKQKQQPRSSRRYVDRAKLGWTHRFRFVVGIVHTNYEAYARQYGVGASLIAAPAIGAVSALTIRAHCHQVIKLSDTLPSFAPGKELTCNVHGVRSEFLDGVDLSVLSSASSPVVGEGGGECSNQDDSPSPVYFIGKLVWAKGFDQMLELQELFRKRNGDYFQIDIYGGGPEGKAIERAFHGRHHPSPAKRPLPPPPSSKETATGVAPSPRDPMNAKDLSAALVFSNPQSIKDQSSQVVEQMKKRQSQRLDAGCGSGGEDVVSQYLSLGFEVCQINGSATYVKESRRGLAAEETNDEPGPSAGKNANPLDIIGDLSGKSFDTGVKTSQAVYNIADSSIKNILKMSFSQLKHPLKARMKRKENDANAKTLDNRKEVTEEEEDDNPHFVFDPPASRYEWRRHPIPARFPGVVDHAQLKNMPHKIFLNPSTSEVLCTTTAEALAMNKFVIIPKHPSNEFFMQFTNCLAYDTLDQCARTMAWALENAPAPLSDEERRKFTWEAATERLMESSVVTVKQARERAETGMDKTDARIAYWLSESGEKSHMLRNLFPK